MVQLYNTDALHYLRADTGALFDAVITDPPYASGSTTLSGRQDSTAQKYTATKGRCPYPDFEGDQMDTRSWAHLMSAVFSAARVRCHEGAVLVAFCDWRQLPTLSDALQWAGWLWRGVAVWDKMTSRPQRGRFRQQAEFILWASNGRLGIDRPVPCLPGVYAQTNVPTAKRYHQTQKPLELMQALCRICTPGGRILDPFCGSGSTLAAAHLEGYDAVGVEKSPRIAQDAAQRLGIDISSL